MSTAAGEESTGVGEGTGRTAVPGVASFALALLTVAGLVTGIALAASRAYEPATWVAYAAVGTSVAAVLLAIVALIGRLGRGWAVAGGVVGILANPLVLTPLLDAIGASWA
ncbi:MAG: hypothetical protein R2717_06395 [Schumannella sp.]|nr:hypothetical protein [Microbacteriaceae bacterium]